MQQESAEAIALKALEWIVGNEELLPVFLGSTGTGIDDLRTRVAEPEFLVSVLDFLTMDDAWVVAFCDQAGLGYETPMQARGSLPGGEPVHWT